MFIVSSDDLHDGIGSGMSLDFDVAWGKECVDFLLKLWDDFGLAAVYGEPRFLGKLQGGSKGDADYVVIFAVDSKEEGGILVGMEFWLVGDVFDFVDDVKVVVGQGVESEYSFGSVETQEYAKTN